MSAVAYSLVEREKNVARSLLAMARALVSRDINRCLAARQMSARAIQLMALRTGVSLGDMEFRQRK